MSFAEEYRKKLVTPEEAVKVVKSDDWIDYGFGHTKPIALDKALAARKNELKNINIRHCLTLSPAPVLNPTPMEMCSPCRTGISAGMSVSSMIGAELTIIP